MKFNKNLFIVFIAFILALNVVFGLSVGYDLPTYNTNLKQTNQVTYSNYKINTQVVKANPAPRTITFEPSQPTTNDNVYCLIQGNRDVPSNEYKIEWFKNGLKKQEGNPLPSTSTQNGDTWLCKLMFYEIVMGVQDPNGIEVASDSVRIQTQGNQNNPGDYRPIGSEELTLDRSVSAVDKTEVKYYKDYFYEIDPPQFTVPGQPNLKLESVVFSPQTPEVNQKITFTVKILNNGDENVGDFYLSYNIDGWLSGKVVNGLNKGQTKTITVEKTFTQPKTITAKFEVDAVGFVSESNENDNFQQVTVTITDVGGNNNDDVTAPVVTLNTPANNRIFNTGLTSSELQTSGYDVNIKFTATDNVDTSFSCVLVVDGDEYTDPLLDITPQNTQPEIPVTVFSTGVYTWNIKCTDASGNLGQGTQRTFTINTGTGGNNNNNNDLYDEDDAKDALDEAKDAIKDADDAIEEIEDMLDDDEDIPFDDDDVDNAKDDLDEAEDYYKLAKEAYDNGNYDDAVQYAELAIEMAEDIIDDMYYDEGDDYYYEDTYDTGYDDYNDYDNSSFDDYFNGNNGFEDEDQQIIVENIPDQEVEEEESFFKSTGFLITMIAIILALIIAEAVMILKMMKNKEEETPEDLPDLEY